MALAVTGSETHPSTSVPTADCLSGLETTGMDPGELAFVQDPGNFYFWNPDNNEPDVDGFNLVAGKYDCGRWQILCVICPGGSATGGSGPSGATGTNGGGFGPGCVNCLGGVGAAGPAGPVGPMGGLPIVLRAEVIDESIASNVFSDMASLQLVVPSTGNWRLLATASNIMWGGVGELQGANGITLYRLTVNNVPVANSGFANTSEISITEPPASTAFPQGAAVSVVRALTAGDVVRVQWRTVLPNANAEVTEARINTAFDGEHGELQLERVA